MGFNCSWQLSPVTEMQYFDVAKRNREEHGLNRPLR